MSKFVTRFPGFAKADDVVDREKFAAEHGGKSVEEVLEEVWREPFTESGLDLECESCSAEEWALIRQAEADVLAHANRLNSNSVKGFGPRPEKWVKKLQPAHLTEVLYRALAEEARYTAKGGKFAYMMSRSLARLPTEALQQMETSPFRAPLSDSGRVPSYGTVEENAPKTWFKTRSSMCKLVTKNRGKSSVVMKGSDILDDAGTFPLNRQPNLNQDVQSASEAGLGSTEDVRAIFRQVTMPELREALKRPRWRDPASRLEWHAALTQVATHLEGEMEREFGAGAPSRQRAEFLKLQEKARQDDGKSSEGFYNVIDPGLATYRFFHLSPSERESEVMRDMYWVSVNSHDRAEAGAGR
eukprot:g6634.t1